MEPGLCQVEIEIHFQNKTTLDTAFFAASVDFTGYELRP